MQHRFTGSSVVVLAAVLAFSSIVFAQTRTESEELKSPPGVTAASRDLSGVWGGKGRGGSNSLLINPKEDPPLTDWGKQRFKSATPSKDPHLRCDPAGVPRIYLFNRPIEILQTSDRVFIFYEQDHSWRQIWTDGRALSEDRDPSYMGSSVGTWERDTLVVVTTAFNDKTWLDNAGHPHSEALHVIERIRRTSHDTLAVTFTIEDPKTYAKAWTTVSRIFKLNPTLELDESFCLLE